MTSRGFTYAFLLPMAIFIVIMLVLYVIILYFVIYKRSYGKMAKIRKNGKKINVQKHLFNAFAICLLCGPTWIIGFFMNLDKSTEGVTKHVLAYIFVILNAFQGLWIFTVYTVLQKQVQVLWM